jgi:hypothetical protein
LITYLAPSSAWFSAFWNWMPDRVFTLKGGPVTGISGSGLAWISLAWNSFMLKALWPSWFRLVQELRAVRRKPLTVPDQDGGCGMVFLVQAGSPILLVMSVTNCVNDNLPKFRPAHRCLAPFYL